jgi:hypothetical protein
VKASIGAGRRRRLGEELEESGLRSAGSEALREMMVEEIDHALRPTVHERRVASSGAFLEPRSDPATWAPGTQLDITRTPVGQQPLSAVRRYADGIASWVLRRTDGSNEWMLFDRPAGSERLSTPPPLQIRTPAHLAPLRHALAQIDGAAIIDTDGVLRLLATVIAVSEDGPVSVLRNGAVLGRSDKAE